MSANLCEDEHLAYLLAAAMEAGRRIRMYGIHFGWQTPEGPVRTLRQDNFQEVGQMLRDENVRSLRHRYPEGGRTKGDRPFRPTGAIVRPPLYLDAVQVIKAVHCYEYQSNEHPGWEASEAHEFMRELVRVEMDYVPGYQEAE